MMAIQSRSRASLDREVLRAGREAPGTLGSLVSSVPVVVVIVGVVIVLVAVLREADGSKPATPRPPAQAAPIPSADDIGPFEPAFPGALPAEPEPGYDISEPLRPRRLRSMALLTVAIVALGSAAAGLLGGTVLLGARLLNRALG